MADSDCKFQVGDRAIVRDHHQFRGCLVTIAEIDRARRNLVCWIQIWPNAPPCKIELDFAIAEDLLEPTR